MATEDLLIGGTSIKTIARITDFSGILSDGPLRGENVTYPGRAGDVHVPKVRGAFIFPVPLVIVGNWLAVNDGINALRTLLDSSTAPLAMSRVRTTTAGTVTETAAGDYLDGLEPGLVGMGAGRVMVNLVNLDGVWS